MKKSVLFRIASDPIVRIGSFVNPRIIPADSVEEAPAKYLGGGALVNVPEIEQLLNGAAARYEITVSGVSSETLALANEEAASIQGAACHIGNAYFDEAWQLIEVEWVAIMRADMLVTQSQASATGRTRSITLSIGTDFTNRSRAPIAFFTPSDQARRSPTDRFFDRIPGISSGTSRIFGTSG